MNPELRKLIAAAGLFCLLLLLLPGIPAGAQQLEDEDFHYHWRLGNVVGTLLGLFFPQQGAGELAFKLQKDGHLRGELLITSPQSKQADNECDGSEIDPRT